MDGGTPARELRVTMLSVAGALAAPLVFVGIILLRKVARRVHIKTRHWNKRLQKEFARWS
jgi:hypothetical protein